jgi:hypothetical protein
VIFASEMFFCHDLHVTGISSAHDVMQFLASLPYWILNIWVYIYDLVKRCEVNFIVADGEQSSLGFSHLCLFYVSLIVLIGGQRAILDCSL